MRLVGFDGKKIKKHITSAPDGSSRWFEALLGVGVTVEDYEVFVEKYDAVIDQFFTKNNLPRDKALYKGTDLISIFFGKGINLISPLIAELLKLVDFVDVYLNYIPVYYDKDGQIPNKIGVYYEEEIEYLTNVQFIDLVTPHFPALCCYSYLQGVKVDVKGTHYYIDECPTILPSVATIGILTHPNTRFLFRGDQVNYVVNAADIFCRYVEERVKKENIIIGPDLVYRLGLPKDKVEYHFIGEKWLNVIKPSRRTKLIVNHKYPHPIYFLFNEAESVFGNSREVIENSRLFIEALKKASKEGGTVKFFEPTDQSYINDKDFLITHTETTDKKTNELKKMGCPARVVDYTFFKN